MIKLYARLKGADDKIYKVVTSLASDNSVEIQQRAFEYMNIMTNKKISLDKKKNILNSMPVSRISQLKFNKLPIDENSGPPTDSDLDSQPAYKTTLLNKKPLQIIEDEDLLDMDVTPMETTNKTKPIKGNEESSKK